MLEDAGPWCSCSARDDQIDASVADQVAQNETARIGVCRAAE
jgi:hypothetical protein